MDGHAVTAWLDRYIAAWKSYDPQAIGDLFTEDAEYRYHPWETNPVSGREAIAASWTEPGRKDAPGSWEASYEPFAVDGNVAIAGGRTRYFKKDGTIVDREYYNMFLMLFDNKGRCASFTEFFMEKPRPKD